MTSPRTGAALVVDALARAGVRRIFTLSGNQVLSIYDACLDGGIELIHVRHEAAAVHMADAWGRLTEQPGVALVAAGPGHANALSALFVAQAAESPLVLLSGHSPLRRPEGGEFQQMRQASMARPVTKASATITQAAHLGEELARAFRTAAAGRPGPVHLSIPADVLEGAIDQTARQSIVSADFQPRPQPLSRRLAGRIFEALQHARRPLVIAGPATMRPSGLRVMARLRDRLGCPVVATESPRGVRDPSLGSFAEILGQADLVLLAGKKLDYTLAFGDAPPFARAGRFIQIDPDPVVLRKTAGLARGRVCLTARADPVPALCVLTDLGGDFPRADQRWAAEVEAALSYRPPEWGTLRAHDQGLLHPAEVFRGVQPWLSGEAVLVSDGGEFGQWAQACLQAPRCVINGPGGSVGSAIPFALAARLACPGARVLAISGDGAFGFHALEYDTAVRYRLPFVAIVGNDAAWNAELQSQVRSYGPSRTVGCELLPSRYDGVVQALGGHGEHVRTAGELPPALTRAFHAGLPACVNVLIERAAAPLIRRPAVHR